MSLPWVLGTWLPSRGLRAVTVGECLGLGLNDEQPQRLSVRERLALAGRLLLARGLAQQIRLVIGLPKRHGLAEPRARAKASRMRPSASPT